MNSAFIIGISALIGIATLGVVWYFWGFAENVRVSGDNKKRQILAEAAAAAAAAEDAAGEEEEKD